MSRRVRPTAAALTLDDVGDSSGRTARTARRTDRLRRYAFVGELPRNPGGKIQRYRLREEDR